MSEKLLTVSIASYNVESTLGDAVRSMFIEPKWMDKLEIIIVNDGSKDQTSEIAHELESIYPGSIVVIDKGNGGYGSTINSSLAIARGKYYKLLDGDDWFNTERFPGFLEFLEHSEADMIVSPYIEVKSAENLVDNHQELSGTAESLENLKIDNKLFVMHEIAMKTQLLKSQNRPIAEHCFYTDAEYVFYCIVASNTIARYDQPIYRYRLGVEGQSVSLQGIRKHQKDLPVVMKRIIDCHAEVSSGIHGAKEEILALCVCNITYHAYRSFMLMENPESYKIILVDIDARLKKERKHEYLIGNGSRLVKLARGIRFTPYIVLCKLANRIFEREIS